MLVLAHGVGEHCIRPGYVSLYESLSDAGVDVYALDHHGHGRSDGMPRGYAEKIDHYVEDLIEYVGLIRSRYDGDGKSPPPLILMGQSMGGLIATMTALKLGNDDVSGLVLTAPALGVDMNVVLRVQKLFAPIIDNLAPRAKIVDAVRPVDLSRNADAVKAYIDDAHVQKGKLVARTCIGMDKAFDVVRYRRDELRCPLLMLHGTSDVVTSMRSSLDFYNNVKSTKKRFLRLNGWYHEIYEDDPTGSLFGNIVRFVSSGGTEFENIAGRVDEGGVIDVEF
jgi:acylglycerol lipase